jgi:hypothetical protein
LTPNKLEENLKRFIFQYIDSVEQLEVLFFVRKNCHRSCTADEISRDLRSNLSSVKTRLQNLKNHGFLKEDSVDSSFQYTQGNQEVENLLTQLTEHYKVSRHLVLELIFSPLKKVRDFADSFILGNPEKKDGDENG